MFSSLRKRILFPVLATALFLAGFFCSATPAAAEVTRNYVTSPIMTSEDLQAFRADVEANSGVQIDAKLGANIVYEGWISGIGQSPAVQYKGTFDGNDFKISLICATTTDNNSKAISLFNAIAEGSAVQNLNITMWAAFPDTASPTNIAAAAINNYGTIKDVTTDCAIIGKNAVSGVVTTNQPSGTIENVAVYGWIETPSTAGAAAGIAGTSNGPITRCVNNATVKSKGLVGGLVGMLNGPLKYSANHGLVVNSSTNSSNTVSTGGLAGRINTSSSALYADISNCYNAGVVSSDQQSRGLGGLVGSYTSDSTNNRFGADCGIRNSFNYGEVIATHASKPAKEAAIIGYPHTGYYYIGLYLVSGDFSNNYYLEGSAEAAFNMSFILSGDEEAAVDAKYTKKDSTYFAQQLYGVLNSGPGGTVDSKAMWTETTNLYPTLVDLPQKPDTEPERPEPGTYVPEVIIVGLGGDMPPMEIESAANLEAFSQRVYNGYTKLDAVLTADIKLNEWDSIRHEKKGIYSPEYGYAGTFDGGGHTIEITTHEKTRSDLKSLFYMIGPDGVVKDLVVSADIRNAAYTGGVTYICYGTIERVRVYGNLDSGESVYTGGIAAESFEGSIIRECANYASVAGYNANGGIVGGNGGTLESCANYGDIVTTGGSTGGLVGDHTGFFKRYINCYNAGTVRAPNAEANQTYVIGVAAFGGSHAFRGTGVPEVTNSYYRTPTINVFNYGKATIGSGASERLGCALTSAFYPSEYDYDEFYNVFVFDESGARIHSGPSGASGLGEADKDPDNWMWGTEFVQSKAPRKNRTEFADGTILTALNDYRHEDDTHNIIPAGTYPGREGGAQDGSPKWVQDGDFPELLIFRQDLLDAAEDELGKAAYQASQANAASESAAQAKAEEIIRGLPLYGIQAKLTTVSYTPATAGTSAAPNGTDGSYTFTATLAKGSSVERTTGNLTLTIHATPYYAPNPGTGSTTPAPSPGGDTPDEPAASAPEIDRNDADVPAVIVTVPPENVTVDETTGVETVTVPEGALTSVIEAAINVATEAGTEPTVEIKVDEVPEVNTVKVEIPLSDLQVVADSAVENVKIASVVGEVTLNTGALKDLIREGLAQGATTVDVVVDHKVTPEEDDTLTEAQKAIIQEDEKVREVYDISIVINQTKLKNFETQDGKLTIGLPYELKTDEVGERVLSVYVADDGATEPMTEGRKYDRGLAIFKTSHLSVYAVTYESEAAAPPETDEAPAEKGASGGGGCSAGMAGFALLAMVAALTRLYKKN